MTQKSIWKQPEFYISTFNAASGDQRYLEAQLQIHKDAGFNMVEFTFKNREYVLEALGYCEKLGLKSIVQDSDFGGIGLDHIVETTDEFIQQAVERYAPFKEVLGFYVWDEPGFESFRYCHDTIERFRKYAPDKLGFSVMVPSYGIYNWQVSNWQADDDVPLEERIFAKYVRQYISETDVDIVSVDYYPYAVKEGARLIENDMWRDMGCIRKYALEADRPFWFYFQGKGDFQLKDDLGSRGMTYAKLAVQTYAALAYGVKQLSYFTSSSLVTVLTDQRGPLFEEVKRLNHRMMHLGTFLLNKTSEKITHTGLSDELTKAYFLNNPEEISFVKSMPDYLIASTFTDDTNNLYLMLSNKDYDNAVDGSITLNRDYDLSAFNDETGCVEPTAVADTLSLHLEPGEGKLFILK